MVLGFVQKRLKKSLSNLSKKTEIFRAFVYMSWICNKNITQWFRPRSMDVPEKNSLYFQQLGINPPCILAVWYSMLYPGVTSCLNHRPLHSIWRLGFTEILPIPIRALAWHDVDRQFRDLVTSQYGNRTPETLEVCPWTPDKKGKFSNKNWWWFLFNCDLQFWLYLTGIPAQPKSWLCWKEEQALQ